MRIVTTIAATLLISSGVAFPDNVSMNRLAECQAAYEEFAVLPETDIHAQIGWWRSQESICSGTGLYEYFLGKLHLRANQYDKATEAFEAGLRLDSEYEKELQLGLGDVELKQQRTEEAEKIYRRVAQAYPDWSRAHHYLGLALWGQGKFEPAIESLNRANELGQTAESFRILTMAYYSIRDYEKSVDALNRAYSLDEAIAGDRDPMIAGIRSYTELGKYEVARNLLAMLLKAKPDIREDSEYLKAGFYLSEKMHADAANE